MAESNGSQNRKDNLAFIIGGLFLLALVFATYTYFNDSETTDTDTTSTLEQIKEAISASTSREDNEESESIREELDTNSEDLGTEIDQLWVANDYNTGDINTGSYNVRSGDTLWEIAEAVYGNGGDWVKILNANSDYIGFLPNGQQALIFSGQTLVIPT